MARAEALEGRPKRLFRVVGAISGHCWASWMGETGEALAMTCRPRQHVCVFLAASQNDQAFLTDVMWSAVSNRLQYFFVFEFLRGDPEGVKKLNANSDEVRRNLGACAERAALLHSASTGRTRMTLSMGRGACWLGLPSWGYVTSR